MGRGGIGLRGGGGIGLRSSYSKNVGLFNINNINSEDGDKSRRE